MEPGPGTAGPLGGRGRSADEFGRLQCSSSQRSHAEMTSNKQSMSVSKAAIRACERAGMWQVAVSLFEEMDVRPGHDMEQEARFCVSLCLREAPGTRPVYREYRRACIGCIGTEAAGLVWGVNSMTGGTCRQNSQIPIRAAM